MLLNCEEKGTQNENKRGRIWDWWKDGKVYSSHVSLLPLRNETFFLNEYK